MSEVNFIPIDKAVASIEGRKELPILALGLNDSTSVNLVVGGPKVGKSSLLEVLAYHLASGNSTFLGMPSTPIPKRILTMNLEENYYGRTLRNKKQIEKLIKNNFEINFENIYVLSENFNPFITCDSDWEIYIEKIKEIRPQIIIIDSMARIYLGSLENSSEAQLIMRRLRMLAEIFQANIFVLHHSVKTPPDQIITLNLTAGSRLVTSESDNIIGVGRTPNGTRYVRPLAYRYSSDTWSSYPTFNITDDGLIDFLGNKTQEELFSNFIAPTQSKSTIVLDYIKEQCESDITSLIKNLVDTGKLSRSTLFDTLKQLVSNNSIIKIDKGSYKYSGCNSPSLDFSKASTFMNEDDPNYEDFYEDYDQDDRVDFLN